MTDQPTLRAELAAAIRKVNAEFERLPPEVQDAIDVAFDPLEREVDAAILTNDRPRALRAIGAWKRHWVATFGEAGQ